MPGHGSLPIPPDRRPYRRLSGPGGLEQTAYTVDANGRVTRTVLRQVGWHGQSGAFYALGDDTYPMQHEPGSWSPMWVITHTDDVPAEEFAALAHKDDQ
jgi:hypothetical protein